MTIPNGKRRQSIVLPEGLHRALEREYARLRRDTRGASISDAYVRVLQRGLEAERQERARR